MIFCIIPAYNEEKTIVQVILQVKPFVDRIVVVDDGSIDNTYNLAKQQNITVLRHIVNRGQGAALETGNQYALQNQADIIVHFDADGQFLAQEIPNIIAPIQSKKADAVFGSRFLGKKSNIPWIKKYIIFTLAKIVHKLFLNINFTDPQSGFRAMSKNVASQIHIEQDKFAHASEILHKVIKKKIKIQEVPITVIYKHFGQKFAGGIKIIRDLFLEKLL